MNDWNFNRKYDKNKSIRSGTINNSGNNTRDLKKHFFHQLKVSNWSERSLFATVFHHQSKFNQIYLSFVFKCGVWCLCEIFLCKASPFPLDTFRCNPWAMTWRQSKCRIEYFNAFVICGPYVNIVRTSYTQSAYIKPHSVEIRMNPAIYTHSNNNTPYTVYLCSIWLKLRIHGLLIFHTKKRRRNTFNRCNGKWWLKTDVASSIQCVFHSCALCICSCSHSSTLSNFLIEQVFRNSSKI